jgi:hypothetical protein
MTWWPPSNPFELKPLTEAERAKMRQELEREEAIARAIRLAPKSEAVH